MVDSTDIEERRVFYHRVRYNVSECNDDGFSLLQTQTRSKCARDCFFALGWRNNLVRASFDFIEILLLSIFTPSSCSFSRLIVSLIIYECSAQKDPYHRLSNFRTSFSQYSNV